MVAYNNSFEGGTDGVDVSSGNSGGPSGDAFSGVSVGVGGTMTYSLAAAMHGAVGVAMTTTASTVAMFGEFTVTPSDRYTWRAYLRFSGLPNVNTLLGRFRDNQAAISTVASILINQNNTIGIMNNAGAQIAALNGTVAILANSVYRLEVGINAVTGACEWKLFTGDSTTVLDQATATAQAFGGFQIGKVRFGRVVGSGFIGTIHYDDIQLQNLATGLPGPISNAQSTVRPNGVVTNPGVFTNQGGAASLEAALSDELDTTFVQSPANPAGASMTVSLPELATGTVTLNVKHKADTASPAISRVYALLQGTTVINTRTVNPLPTVTTAFSWSTSAAETSAITDRTQLRVRWTDSVV
jgi:hypothetical protein